MKITRRLLFLLVLALWILCVTQAQTNSYTVFIGTYTDKTGSKGIYAYEFDAATGKLTPKGLAAETSNPSWLVIHPNGKWAYAANESGKQSSITAFSIDAKSAKLTQLNQLPALGEDPCYLSLDKTGKFLFAANYTSGNVVVFPILPDGKLGAASANVKDQGALGPNKERQEAPHAHWIEPDQSNRRVYVADLGLDRVLVDSFDPADGKLVPATNLGVPLAPGSGPRHAAFSSSGDFLYVLGEILSTVTLCVPEAQHGFKQAQVIPMLPPDFKDRNEAAEIAMHPNGKWLFASNRGHDSIVVFKIDPTSGTLRLTAKIPTGGKEPRHFALDPTGRFLLAENQNSNSIVIFRINPETGALSQVYIREGIPSPVCLTFLRTP